MANMSDTVITLKGNRKNIQKTNKIIKEFLKEDSETNEKWLMFKNKKNKIYEVFSEYKEYLNSLKKEDFEAGFSCMRIFSYEIKDNQIDIIGCGRWSSPSLFFRLLAIKLNLNMVYADAEAGCDFFFLMTKNGDLINEYEKGYYCEETINYIFGGSVEDFLESIEWYFESDVKIDAIENLLKKLNINKNIA